MKLSPQSAVLAALAAASVVPLAALADPSPTLYGAGATLPAIAYTGSSWLSGKHYNGLVPAGTTTASFSVAAIGSTQSFTSGTAKSYGAGDLVTINDGGGHAITGKVVGVSVDPSPATSGTLTVQTLSLVSGTSVSDTVASGAAISFTGAPTTAQRLSVPGDTGSMFGAFTLAKTGLATTHYPTTAAFTVAGAGFSQVVPVGTTNVTKYTLNDAVSISDGTSSLSGRVVKVAATAGTLTVKTFSTASTGASMASGANVTFQQFPAVSYCQTGSGYGRNILIGTNGQGTGPNGAGTQLQGACPDYGTSVGGTSTTGISLPATQTEPNFTASDAPLSSANYTAFFTNQGSNPAKSNNHGEPVQFPTVAGAIAVVYNNPTTADVNGGKPVNFTELQICKIFSGQITNWNQLGFGNKPITMIVRSDDSGTSFSFSNHLSYVCGNTHTGTFDISGAVTGFSTQTTFSPGAFPGGTVPASPAVVVGASGNGGVVNTVLATDGAIGYAEVADGALRNAVNGSHLQVGTVSMKTGINPNTTKAYVLRSPTKNFPKSFKVAAGALLTDEAINGNDASGRPNLVGLSPVQPGCMLLIDPSSYATSTIDANGDYQFYPIAAVTYLLGNHAGNGDDAGNLQALFDMPWSNGNLTPFKADITTIGTQNGFAYLSGVTPNPTKAIQSCLLP